MSAVSPREEDQQVEKAKERDKAEEELRRAFGTGSEEAVERERQGNAEEEAVRARARKAEIAPKDKEVEEHSFDHAVFRSRCPHSVKGRRRRADD